MKNKMIACLTTAMIFASSAAMPAAGAAGGAADTPVPVEMPAWVPDDFDSALEFSNTYGATHIADGVICMVFAEEPDHAPQSTPRYEVAAEGDNVLLLNKAAYTHTSENSSATFEVFVYHAVSAGEFAVTFSDAKQTGAAAASYTFDIDSDLNAVETDIYSWLPDCVTEYTAFTGKNTNVCAKDQYVLFCFDSSAGTMFEWCGTGLEETDPSVIDYVFTSECSELSAEPLDGGEIHRISVYQAKKDGRSVIRYDYVPGTGSPYQPDGTEQSLIADCMVIDDAQAVLLSNQSRVTIVDYDTGELLEYTGDSVPRILTDVRYERPSGTVTSEPIYNLETNPAVLGKQFTSFFDADYFTFDLDSDSLPEGYEFPNFVGRMGYYLGEASPEDAVSVTRYENGSANIVFKLKNSALIEYKTIISFYDADTGELIDLPGGAAVLWKERKISGSLGSYEHEYYNITSNPWTADEDYVYEPLYENWDYYLLTQSKAGKYGKAQFEVVARDLTTTEISCKLKWIASGDLNGDEDFTMKDVTLLQKYLLGTPNTKLADWNAADFLRDGKLDAADLALMKRSYFLKTVEIVKPDVQGDYYDMFTVIGDNLNLYAGPGTDYTVITTFPLYTDFWERGHNKENNDWVYVEYGDLSGWIKTLCDNSDEPNVQFHGLAVDKPVIYLYPEEETDVHLELELTESELSTTYPKYNNGWDVTASPDGTLLNKADGTHHKYLFWDAVNCRTRFDFSKGFCVAGSDTEQFLKETLTHMGLTEAEMNEFIVYWLPRMEHNAYNLISFQGDAYTNTAKLHISPEPDSLLRVFMTYVPLENAVEIEPQRLETFERKGFTVVEWGGTEMPAMNKS